MNFLSEIIARKRMRVEEAKQKTPLTDLCATIAADSFNRLPHSFSRAFNNAERLNIIAEFKRRSPSKGAIRSEADPKEIARSYQSGGAVAISVLTEEDYFDGSLKDLKSVKETVKLPVLRKDFLVDEYQVYESAANGADAVLLIVAALEDDQLRRLLNLAEEEMGLDALVEVHTESEMHRAVACGARLIGVNNRNLSTFEVTLETSIKLAVHAPSSAILVSESGLKTTEDLKRLHAVGYKAFLIGESLMRAQDPQRKLKDLLE